MEMISPHDLQPSVEQEQVTSLVGQMHEFSVGSSPDAAKASEVMQRIFDVYRRNLGMGLDVEISPESYFILQNRGPARHKLRRTTNNGIHYFLSVDPYPSPRFAGSSDLVM